MFLDGLNGDGQGGSVGAVCLAGASITGQLSLSGARLSNRTGPALLADSATIGGAVYMNEGFTATGTGVTGAVRLFEAKIGAGLAMDGATVTNETGPALVADLLTVTGDAALGGNDEQRRFRATGMGQRGTVIQLRGAGISGQLSLQWAQVAAGPVPAEFVLADTDEGDQAGGPPPGRPGRYACPELRSAET